ncbi:MAG: RluA family pseudouridine synthase [bacterium]|nr:RluA family pseudouridine synthase [bacterium]
MSNFNIEILYEDDNVLAINKPAGLVVHPDGRTKEESVSEWLLGKYPDAEGVGESIKSPEGEEIKRSGVVHRIDRETSGVLLLAKTELGFENLKLQFQNREIHKTYLAFVHGIVKDDHGVITLPIGKSPSDFRRWSAGRGSRGFKREAVTYFKVLKRSDNATLIEAKPKTGRTHQIRVHFTALQRPLVGDKLYAASKPSLYGFDRLALHSREIEFKDCSDVVHQVKASCPKDFLNAFKEIGYMPLDLP